jgi:hypothetical protein
MTMEAGMRVTDAWVTSTIPIRIELNFAGITAGSQPLDVEPNLFALIAAMMSFGRPVYYSPDRSILSTDPFFASNAPDTQEFTQALKVIDADLLWNFKENAGSLILTLQDKSLVHQAFDDPALLVGWALSCRAHSVVLDGEGLKSRQDAGRREDPPVATVSVNARIF